MVDEPAHHIECATYTHARRHPIVIGQIGGWTPPFQLSLPQVGVLLGTYLLELQTWRWWGALLPGTVGLVVAVGLPCVLAWAVRSARIEGRSLVRAALGYLVFASAPRTGWVAGRPYRHSPAADLRRARVYVAGEGGR
ncbi:MAG TPA: TcpE family conjugal transfer membrane protein [Acidimicrobiales bacterium]